MGKRKPASETAESIVIVDEYPAHSPHYTEEEPTAEHYAIYPRRQSDGTYSLDYYRTDMTHYLRYVAMYGRSSQGRWTYTPPEGAKIY